MVVNKFFCSIYQVLSLNLVGKMRIFTDASTRKISGIAFACIDNDDQIVLQGKKVINQSDNNQAELEAIAFALENMARTNERHILYTDSLHALGYIYRKPDKRDTDTTKKIRIHLNRLGCQIRWIKGHGTDNTIETKMNKYVDKVAKKAREHREKLIILEKKRRSKLNRKYQSKNRNDHERD